MEILSVISAVLVDLAISGFFLYCLLYNIINFFKQCYIRKFCRYRGTKERPGRACVICAYNCECDRADESSDYRWYIYCHQALLVETQELFDEIWEEEKAKDEESKRMSK